MKFCSHCGNELDDEAIVCPNCGCPCDGGAPNDKSEPIHMATKVFLVLSCVVGGATIFPLLWMLPMTVHYFRCCNEGKDPSLAFKICTLIFVNVISGILMLVDKEK